MGTRVALVAGAGADAVDCPGGVLDVVGAEPADVLATASGASVGDCAAEAGDVAWAETDPEADPEADELESCGLHPTMRTPATARAAPVSNVRRAPILIIFLNPLNKHGPR
jgi:hypothetical protein